MRNDFLVIFDNEFDLKQSILDYRAENYEIIDAYTPYAVHGLDIAMGLKPSRLTKICFMFAFLGLAVGLWGQYWTSAVNWPINIGGKPWNSLPAFMPIAFEITILFAGLGTVLSMLGKSRLLPGKKHKFIDARITDDRFALILREDRGNFNEKTAVSIARKNNAVEWENRLEAV